MPSNAGLPVDTSNIDIHADQRGRIIGTCVALIVVTDAFVVLRLVSRKLARAGYWVRIQQSIGALRDFETLIMLSSGTMFWLWLRWCVDP